MSNDKSPSPKLRRNRDGEPCVQFRNGAMLGSSETLQTIILYEIYLLLQKIDKKLEKL